MKFETLNNFFFFYIYNDDRLCGVYKKSALLLIDVAVAVVAVSAVLGGPRFTLTMGLRTRSIPLSRPFHQGAYIGTAPAALLPDVGCFFVYVPIYLAHILSYTTHRPQAKSSPEHFCVQTYVWCNSSPGAILRYA